MKTETFTSKVKIASYFVIFVCLLGLSAKAQNWAQITSGTTKTINTIYFSSSTVGYLGGNDSLLMKTTNGGATWTNVNYTGVTFYPGGEHILNLQFLNDDVGFMSVGPYSGTYGTTNGGLTWDLVPIISNQCFNKGLFFFDENNGFIGGSGCFQGELMSYVSNSNWLTGTWNQVTLNSSSFFPDNYITDIHFYNTNYGLAASRSGYVYRTTDGGLNWDSIPTPLPLNRITSVLIVNDTLAYAGFEAITAGFGLYISTDAGLTWNYDGGSATFYYPDFYTLHKSGDGTIYAGGVSDGSMQGLIFSYNQNSPGWVLGAVDQQINDVSSYNDSIAFAVGDSGYIVVNHPELITGVHQINYSGMEVEVFPNPVEDKLFVRGAMVKHNEQLSFTLYSAIGEVVKTGQVKSFIDISELPMGLYILEIRAGGTNVVRKVLKT